MFHDQHGKSRPAVAHRDVSDAVHPAVLALRDMSGDNALDDLVRPHWSRVTISRHVQCLRSVFRHAAMHGWVRPRLAEMIDAPRLYTHERLPQGPQWSQVQQLLDANRGDAPVQIRNYAMLVLLAVYGLASDG